jgi:hypothetical protein
MAKDKISDFSPTASDNTDINSINIAEGCAPSGINNAIRALMSDLKNWQTGSASTSNTDALAVAGGGTGSITASGARTNLSAAQSGANTDITSLGGLTTPITVAQGGTGFVAQRTITTVGRATNVVTIVTSAAHGYVVNDIVTIAAVTNTSVNGTFVIASVPSSTSFTYAQSGTDYANTADTGTTTNSSYFSANNMSGITSVIHGGTGVAAFTPNTIIVGNGTSTPIGVASSTNGNVLTATAGASVTAGSFVVGTQYTITSLGSTTFTGIGATSGTFTGTINNAATPTPAAGTILTVTSGSGAAVGQFITGSGVASGTKITEQISSTAWRVNNSQSVGSTTITYTNPVFTATGVGTGTGTATTNTWTSVAIPTTTLTSGTAISASGAFVDFIGIPSWVKSVTIMFSGVSTSGTSYKQIQLGTSSAIDITGYLGSSTYITSGSVSTAIFSTGFGIRGNGSADLINGSITINNLTGNTWVASGILSGSNLAEVWLTSGSKALSDVLLQIRITTVNGTDTFDAGLINIIYE